MKRINIFIWLITVCISASCGNKVEEIKNQSNGQLTVRYEYYLDDSGQKIKDGKYVEWYNDGTKRLEQNFENGKLQGEAIFHQSIDSICFNNYKNGKLDGTCILKNSKGTLLSKYQYKNGDLDGQQEYNYSNGKLMLKAIYNKNIPSKKWFYFNDKGESIGTFTFKNGVCQELIGTWKNVIKRENYYIFNKDGSFIFKAPMFQFDENASELLHGQTIVGNRLRNYSNNGALIDEFMVFLIQKDIILLEGENGVLDLERVK